MLPIHNLSLYLCLIVSLKIKKLLLKLCLIDIRKISNIFKIEYYSASIIYINLSFKCLL